MTVPRASVVLAILLLTAACARPDAQPGRPAPDPIAPDQSTDPDLVASDYTGRFQALVTVLESPEHGPQLCAGTEDSYPPQCGGPDILGWDWTGLDAESASGTTWGGYVVVGSWDGTALTLTEPPRAPTDADRPEPVAYDFSSPCPTPVGGWVALDPARADEERIGQAAGRAESVPGYGGLWIDTGPAVTVLNVSTTGDHVAMKTALREVWGGALCVSSAARDESTLRAAQRAMDGRAGVLGSAPNVRTGQLEVQVYVATQELQDAADAEFGPGVLTLQPLLVPID